jgi:hypothetical protein
LRNIAFYSALSNKMPCKMNSGFQLNVKLYSHSFKLYVLYRIFMREDNGNNLAGKNVT